MQTLADEREAFQKLARTLSDEQTRNEDLVRKIGAEHEKYETLECQCRRYKRQLDATAQESEQRRLTIMRLKARVAGLEETLYTRSSTGDPSDDEEEGATSDLFACINCSSMWLLTEGSNHKHTVTLAKTGYKDRCGTCSSTQVSDLMSVKDSVRHSEQAVYVGRPFGAGSPRTQSETCVKFVANLLSSGPTTAAAKVSAEKVVDTVSHCVAGDAPADRTPVGAAAAALDAIPNFVAKGFAWLATDLFGLPPFLGAVVGRLCATVILGPHLHQVAQYLRVVDVVFNGDESGDSIDYLMKDAIATNIKKDLNDHHPSIDGGTPKISNSASERIVDSVSNLGTGLPVDDIEEIGPPPPRAPGWIAEEPWPRPMNPPGGTFQKRDFNDPGNGLSFGGL